VIGLVQYLKSNIERDRDFCGKSGFTGIEGIGIFRDKHQKMLNNNNNNYFIHQSNQMTTVHSQWPCYVNKNTGGKKWERKNSGGSSNGFGQFGAGDNSRYYDNNEECINQYISNERDDGATKQQIRQCSGGFF